MARYSASDFKFLFDIHAERAIGAFVAAANRIKNRATQLELEEAIRAQNIDAIVYILGIDITQWLPVVEEIASIYDKSGKLEMAFQKASINEQIDEVKKQVKEAVEEFEKTIEEGQEARDPYFPTPPEGAGTRPGPRPGGVDRIVVEFDRRNVRAENYIRERSSTLIREITEDQREMIRSVLDDGIKQGLNPKTLVTRLVGHVDKVSGRRQGGVIGLTTNQSRWVMNAWFELDNGDYTDFLQRGLVDKRSARTIRVAIRDGKELTPEQIQTIMNRYQNRMLQMRAETLARTEMLRSQNAAKYEAALQAMEASGTKPTHLLRQWKTAFDNRVRETHIAMHDQIVKGADELFVTPDDHGLLYPGDTSNGAPAEEVINCRCMVIHVVDYKAMARENGWIK